MKYFSVSLFVLLLSSILFSQERMILRTNGEQIKLNHKKDLREAITDSKIKRSDGKVFNNQFASKPLNIAGLVDTMSYRSLGGSWNTNFGFFGQDEMLMWFEAPTDMTIKGIGFTCSDDAGAANATISLRLIRLNWTKDQLKNFVGDKQIGYFPSDGDGMNNIDPFGEGATGVWVSTDENNPLPPWTNNADPAQNTFDYYLWEEWGYGWPILPVASPSDAPVYQWIATKDFSFEPSVSKGDIFAIVATHDGINLDADRIGFWSDQTIGYPGWKYYENGRTAADVDAGWWVRPYTWDFAVAVDITSCLPPYIRVEPLTTTLSTEPRDVCAEIDIDIDCFGGSDSVNIELVYVLNDIDTNKVEMSSSDNYNFCAEIPGQSPSTRIKYWVQVTDNDGFIYSSQEFDYFIFSPKWNSLVVFNGFTEPTGYPQSYYFGTDTSYVYGGFAYDTWAYGPLTKELVDNYIFIVENCTTGPNDDNRTVIKEWFANNYKRVYMLWGQEWLGKMGGFADVGFNPGDFEYDILGLTFPYNDVSYDGTSGQELPSKFMPKEGTALGGPMFDLVAQFNAVDSTKIDSVLYDPIYETGINNWLDGFEVREDDPTLEVFMKAETRGIGGAPNVREVNVGVSRNTGQNHMSVFMAYDPISINSSPYYYWFGRGDVSSQMQAIYHLPVYPSVDDGDLNNIKFSLSQNYPNPFNPSTTIKYSIPINVNRESEVVSLVVYDILGREVATLVNKGQKAGNYEVNFDGYGLTSGIYFYKLTSGAFLESKKMILLK